MVRGMTRITRNKDCRNSPKNAFMQELAAGLFLDADDAFRSTLAEDAVLRRGGRPPVTGADAVEAFVARRLRERFDTVVIHHAITHGRVGAANGVCAKGADETPFAVVVEFASVKADSVALLNLYGL